MAIYVTTGGETLARMPGMARPISLTLLQMLVSTACGPEQRDMVRVTPVPARLEMLWGEEIADLRETIAV